MALFRVYSALFFSKIVLCHDFRFHFSVFLVVINHFYCFRVFYFTHKGNAKIMPLLIYVRRSHGQRNDMQNRRSVGEPLPRSIRNFALQKEQ